MSSLERKLEKFYHHFLMLLFSTKYQLLNQFVFLLPQNKPLVFYRDLQDASFVRHLKGEDITRMKRPRVGEGLERNLP